MSIAIVGSSPSYEVWTARDPRDFTETLVGSPAFVERFARFLNAKFDNAPGKTAAEDAVYYVAKYVLEKKLPFEEMFVGRYDLAVDQSGPHVVGAPFGLGWFRMKPWLERYAGNELDGYMLVAAYRILQNTTGLTLVPSTNAPGVDVSAKGRAAQPCAGCHTNGWYALDHVARVLARKRGTGNAGDPVRFEPPSDGPQQVAETSVKNDEDLVRFTGTTGPATSGTFSMQLDLSAIGISTAAGVDDLTIVP